MTALRAIALGIATTFLALTTMPALAQTKPADATSTAPSGTPTTADAPVAEKAEKPKKAERAEKKAAKKAERAQKKADKKKTDTKAAKKRAKKAPPHDDEVAGRSNAGGKARGLDRADQVAGEHGKQGRDTARTRQGR